MSYGSRRSLDIIAYGDLDELLVAEVKNWSAISWTSAEMRRGVLAQLGRHEDGIAEVQRRASSARRVVGKVLIVERTGYLRGMAAWPDERRDFENTVRAMGWAIEDFPGHQTGDLSTLIRALL